MLESMLRSGAPFYSIPDNLLPNKRVLREPRFAIKLSTTLAFLDKCIHANCLAYRVLVRIALCPLLFGFNLSGCFQCPTTIDARDKLTRSKPKQTARLFHPSMPTISPQFKMSSMATTRSGGFRRPSGRARIRVALRTVRAQKSILEHFRSRWAPN